MIARNLESIVAEAVYSSMRAFYESARIRIEDELRIKVRIQNAVDGMVQKPVAHACFVNIARFRIIDTERFIRPVLISFIDKLLMQCPNIVGQMKRKSFDVFTAALVTKEFTPGDQQIFHGNGIVVDMARPPFTLSLSLSQFRLDFESDQRGIFDLGYYYSSYRQRS